jgi:hypothetical protein
MADFVTVRRALAYWFPSDPLRLLVAGLAAGVLLGLGTAPVAAQPTYVDGDDGAVAVMPESVDCDGTGTSAETSIADAVAGGATDIDVCGGTYAGESFTIDSAVDIRPVSGSGTVVITTSTTSGAPFVIDASDVTLRDLTVRHTGGGQGVNTVDIVSGTNVDLVDLSIARSNLDDTFRAINLGGNQSVRIENCTLTGGAIGDGKSTGDYEIIGNTIRGAGDEGIWVFPEGGDIVLRENVIETTADGDPTNDRRAISIYGATSLVLEKNELNATGAPLLLGDDIPVKTNAGTEALTTAEDLRALLGRNTINGQSPGKVTFLTKADGTTLHAADGGNHIVRTGVTNNPNPDGSGGSGGFAMSALQGAPEGGVIHLTGGASYNEGVTLASTSPSSSRQDKDVGFSTPTNTSATIADLTLDGAYTVSIPSGEIKISNSLTLGSGSSIEGAPLVLADGVSLTDNGLSSGALTATRMLSGGETEAFDGIGLTLTDDGSGSAPGSVTVTRVDGRPVTKGDGSIARYYHVAADTESGLDVDLTFAYDESELNGRSEADLSLFRSDDGGDSWAEIGISSSSTQENTLRQSLSSFSRFTAAASGATLPVELTRLEARADGDAAVLQWATAAETNNAGFRVQHKTNTGYETLAFVEGTGTTSQSSTYRYRATDLDYGPHTFRLQQVDRDGTTQLSDAVDVFLRPRAGVQVSKVYPNPVSSRGRLEITLSDPQDVTVKLYDALGRYVTTIHEGPLAGKSTHQMEVSAGGLANGTYFLRIRGESTQATRRLVVVK